MDNFEKLTQLQLARGYILANPLESKAQQVKGSGLSTATIARARAELISEGKYVEPRNALAPELPIQRSDLPAKPPKARATRRARPVFLELPTTAPVPIASPPPPPAPAPSVPNKTSPPKDNLLDHAAMLELADMVDKMVETGDDAEIQKRLQKQCLTFAFRTDLHPDTRMSASTMWGKIKDMAREKDLGPGKPKTREDALERLRQMLVACGPGLTIAAVHAAFEVQNGETTDQQAPTPIGTPETLSPTGHTGAGTETEDLRRVEMGSGERQDPEPPDLPRPPA